MDILFTSNLLSKNSFDYNPHKIIVKFNIGVDINNNSNLIKLINEKYEIALSIKPYINPKLLWYNTNYSLLKQNYNAPEENISRIFVLDLLPNIDVSKVHEILNKKRFIDYSEPLYNRYLMYKPNDVNLSSQWYLDTIKVINAWDKVRADSSIVVGVVDAGYDFNNKELSNVFKINYNEYGKDAKGIDKSINGIDDDGNGLIDDWRGYDFVGTNGYNPDNNPEYSFSTHGIATSGIIGSEGNNNYGIAGVAFGCKILPVKIVDDVGNISNGFEGIIYASKMGAKIINYSIGGKGKSKAEEEIIDYIYYSLGSLVVAASGNTGNGVDQFDYIYPAAYDNCLSVTATRGEDYRADFSVTNYKVDMSAPGSFIFTTGSNNQFDYENGTSFSSPIVAGACALVQKQNPNLSVEQIREIITTNIKDISANLINGSQDKMGSGRLDINKALTNNINTSSARMISYSLEDQNNKIPEIGESIALNLSIKNILANTNTCEVSVFCSSHPEISISKNNFKHGPLKTSESFSVSDSFNFKIPQSFKIDEELVLKVVIKTDDISNTQYIIQNVSPSYSVTNLNNIVAAVNSKGNIAYTDLSRGGGEGLTHKNFGSDLLYHSGLMIGVTDTKLSDVVRRGFKSDGIESDFYTTQPYRLTTDINKQIGISKFNDSFVDELLRVGVNVELNTIEYKSQELKDVLFLIYKVQNNNKTKLFNLHCGLYLDWDLNINNNDKVEYDLINNIGYMFDNTTRKLYAGTILLSNQKLNFSGIENLNPNNGIKPFPQNRKWDYLSSGTSLISDVSGVMSVVIGRGGEDLNAGETKEFAFAIIITNDADSLINISKNAREKYKFLIGVNNDNSFSRDSLICYIKDKSIIVFELNSTKKSNPFLEICNISGEVILNKNLSIFIGKNKIETKINELANGVYFYRLHDGNSILTGKILVEKE